MQFLSLEFDFDRVTDCLRKVVLDHLRVLQLVEDSGEADHFDPGLLP